MTAILTILLAATVGMTLAKWLRLPVVPLLVVAGVGLSLTGLSPDAEFLNDALILGLAFLVFVAGTELNPARAGRQRRPAMIVGTVQFLAMAGLGAMAAVWLGLSWQAALYVGLAMTASSTLVVVTILRQRQQFFEPFGRLVLGVLLLQDLLVIIAIGGLSGLDDGAAGVLYGLGATVVLIILAWSVSKWVAPWAIGRLNLDEESLLLTALAILFAFIGLSFWMGLPLVVGALLAGIALSGFPVQGLVRGQVSSLADFFLAVFFVTLGALLVWPSVRELAVAAGLTVLVLVVTPPLVAWTSRRIGLSSRVGVESGLFLAQCSEFSLVVALLGLSQGHLTSEVFNLIAIVTVVTMILTPFVATDRHAWFLMRLRPGGAGLGGEAPNEGHVLMLGCGRLGERLITELGERGERVLVVDDDQAVVDRLRAAGVRVVRGDGADMEVLEAVGARSAKAIISTMRRIEDHERVLHHVWEAGVPVLTRLFSPADAERLAVLGAVPVIEADVAADQAVAWFDERFRSRAERAAASSG
ncbi:MAG: potassium transporter [Phycisphaerales bacterium]|nr:MAG: potassium transporter [Phycisphaerales bacterium]